MNAKDSAYVIDINEFNPNSKVGRHDVRLKLPGNLTIFDIRWFSIYDTKRNFNLGHVIIPEDLNVPPALVEIFESARDTTMPNCEMLHSNLRIAWSVFAPSITIELAANLKNENEYMAFGISGKEGATEMIGSDVAVAYRNGFLVKLFSYFTSTIDIRQKNYKF